MTLAVHCDAECDSWQRYDSDNPVFYTLTAPDESENHFCSLDCCLKWVAAHSEPNEIVR